MACVFSPRPLSNFFVCFIADIPYINVKLTFACMEWLIVSELKIRPNNFQIQLEFASNFVLLKFFTWNYFEFTNAMWMNQCGHSNQHFFPTKNKLFFRFHFHLPTPSVWLIFIELGTCFMKLSKFPYENYACKHVHHSNCVRFVVRDIFSNRHRIKDNICLN